MHRIRLTKWSNHGNNKQVKTLTWAGPLIFAYVYLFVTHPEWHWEELSG